MCVVYTHIVAGVAQTQSVSCLPCDCESHCLLQCVSAYVRVLPLFKAGILTKRGVISFARMCVVDAATKSKHYPTANIHCMNIYNLHRTYTSYSHNFIVEASVFKIYILRMALVSISVVQRWMNGCRTAPGWYNTLLSA